MEMLATILAQGGPDYFEAPLSGSGDSGMGFTNMILCWVFVGLVVGALGCILWPIAQLIRGSHWLYWKFIDRASLIETPLPLFSALFLIVGIQFILMGLVAEMLTRNYYENTGRKIYNIKEKINL